MTSWKHLIEESYDKMKTLVVVLGPTGVGKTELCIRIAETFNIPIINADSRQIYSELPIGTAAPTQEQQQRVKHFLVGNHHIGDYYSASLFEEDVLHLLDEQFKKGSDIALLTGGSMMYIDAVCKGIDDIPTIDDTTRTTIKKRYEEEGLAPLLEELRQLDPEYYEIVDRNNPKRVVHAVEICTMTGKTYTSFRKNTIKQRPFNILKIGLTRERTELYERINHRVRQMIDQGLEEEARRVYPLREANALNTVGYKEMFEYFDGKISHEEAITKIQGNTRKYCRKQQTWFKKDADIKWFSPDNIEEIIKYITDNVQI